MQYSEAEIIEKYKRAETIKEQKDQISILAELNGCDVSTIKEILKRNGMKLPAGKIKTANVKTGPKINLAYKKPEETNIKEPVETIPSDVFNTIVRRISELSGIKSDAEREIEVLDAFLKKYA